MKIPIVLLSMLALTAQPHAANAAETSQPNVLFFVVDDLRPELGCYGKDYIKSPNIDALAKSGMVFDRAYVQQAVCSPSRTAVMTGLRPDTTKVWDLTTSFRIAQPDVVTVGQHFKNNGYFVQGMGKVYHGRLNDEATWSVPWQVPKSQVYALEESIALMNKANVQGEPDAGKVGKAGDAVDAYAVPDGEKPTDAAPAADEGGKKKKDKKNKKGKDDGGSEGGKVNSRGPIYESADVPDNTFQDGKVADLAVQTLGELSKKNQPFFLAVGFIKPHLPWVSPKKYWDMYDPAQIEIAPNPFLPKDAPEYAINPNDGEFRAYKGVPGEGDVPPALQHKLKQAYFAGVSYTDAQVGRVMAELKRLNLDKNTIIVLWGDHGWKLGEHNAWGKHTNVENDTNAPLIFSAPGLKNAGSHSQALVEFVDIYPTLADLAGLSLPSHLEGISLKPLLENPNREWKTAAFSQYPRNSDGKLMGYSMRTDRYRFTVWVKKDDHTKVDATELYDHQTDPQENVNIAAHPDQAAVVEKLMTQWKAGWQGAKPSVK